MSEVIETEFGVIPSDPAARERITKAINEMVDSLVREDAEKALRKEITAALKEELNVSPEMIARFATWKHKGNADKVESKVVEEVAAFRVLTNAVKTDGQADDTTSED